jgi:predicted transcriptional regulator
LNIAWAKILLRRLEEKDFPVQSAQNLKEKLGKGLAEWQVCTRGP